MTKAYGETIIGLINQVSTKLDKSMRCCFCDCSLTIPQIAVITLLYRNGEMKIGDISANMGLTNSTISGIIDRLERMELAKRLRDEDDRRIVRVVLTEKAHDMRPGFGSRLEDFMAHCFRETTEEEMDAIINGLGILNRILDYKK